MVHGSLRRPDMGPARTLVRVTLCVYLTVSIPFRLAFTTDWSGQPGLRLDRYPGLSAVDLLATAFFMWETMCLIHQTPGGRVAPYGDIGNNLVANKRSLRISWSFLSSLVVTLPLEYFSLLTKSQFSSNLFMLNRLLRLIYLPQYLNDVSTMMEKRGVLKNIGFQRAWKLVFAMAIAGHWCGCGFFLVASMQAQKGNKFTWPEEIGLYAVSGQLGGNNLKILRSIPEVYITSLYWAFITMITTGFGDIVPLSVPETVWCMFSMVVGVVITTCAIANLQLLVTNMDAAMTDFQMKMDLVKKYIRYRKLTSDLTNRIISFYEYSWDLLKGADEEKFLNELPGSLQQQVANFMCRDLISSLPVLRKANNALLNAVADCAENNIYSPNDHVLKPGEQIRGAILVSRGELLVLKGASIERKMQRFDRFAEESLFIRKVSDCWVKSKTFAEVFIIPARAFQEIIDSQCDESHITKMKETSMALVKNAVKANKMFGSAVDVVPWRGFYKHCHPNSRFRKIWDCIVLLGLIYYIFALPLNVMWAVQNVSFVYGAPLLAAGYIIDLILLVNVIFNFNYFMYSHEGLIIFDRYHIRSNFSQHHCVGIEVIACMPVDLLAFASFGARYLHFYRLTKVVRIPSIVAYLHKTEKVLAESKAVKIDQSLGRVLKLNFIMIVVCHWVGCLWYSCADISELLGLTANWRDTDEADDSLSIDHADFGGLHAYLRSVYWAIVGMSTVGYGDIVPTNIFETTFALICVLFGGLVLPSVVGGLAAYMGSFNLAQKNHRKKLQIVRRYMRKSNLDASLVDKTMRYYDYLFSRQGGVDEEAIVDELPGPLRQGLAMHVNGTSIDAVPFFSLCDDTTKQLIVSILKPRVFLPDDIITNQGEVGTEMFFIERGKVVVLSSDKRISFCTLGNGDYFGESCLLGATVRVATVKALTYCDCFVLSKDDFSVVTENFKQPKRQSITDALTDTVHKKKRRYNSICRNISHLPKCHKKVGLNGVNEVSLEASINAVKFHPDSTFCRNWNMVILVVCVYNAWEIPFRLAFGSSPSSYMIGWGLDLIMLVDIYLSYHEFSFVREGELVIQREKVKQAYVSGKLRADALSALPLDLIAYFVWRGHRYDNYLLALLRIPRLLRLTRLLTILRDISRAIEDTNLKKAPIQLIELLCGVVLIAHFAACGFYALAHWKNHGEACIGLDKSETIVNWANEYTECRWADTWIQQQIIGGKAPIDGGNMWQLYLRAFNWALPTLVVVVIGDVVPVNSAETLYAFLWIVVGVTVNAAIIGNVANIVANLENELAEYIMRADQIKSFMHRHHVRHDLQDRVEHFMAYLWATHSGMANEDSFIKELPYTLQIAVTEHTRMGLIRDCPFFDFCSIDIIKALTLCLKPLIFSVGDILAHEDDMGQEMFFLERGSVEVASGDGKTVFATLSNKGCFFGETSVFFKTKRQNTLRAATFCEVLQLDKCDLDEELRQRDFDLSRMLVVFTNIANSNKRRNAAVKANLNASRKDHTKLHKLIQLEDSLAQGSKVRNICLPNSKCRSIWDFLSLIFTINIVLVIPYRVAFVIDATASNMASWLLLDGSIDIFFILDTYARSNHFTFIQNGATVTNKEEIRSDYRKKGMLLDVISCLPLEVLVTVLGFQYIFFLRLGHLIRVRRLPEYVHRMEGYLALWNIRISSATALLLKMFFFYMLANHWCACIWFIIHRYLERDVQFTWATTDCTEGDGIASNGCLAKWDTFIGEHNVCNQAISTCYIRAVHFVVTTLSTVGYGDISPVTELETLWQNAVVLIGACFFAGIIGAFAAYLSHNDTSGSNAFKLKIQKLQEYMNYRKLPSQLQNDILTFHRHKWEQSHVLDQQAILSILPLPLQRELSFEVLKHVIYQVPILNLQTKVVQQRICHALQLQVSPPKSDIYRVGDIGWDIFFIGKGICRITLPSDLSDLDSAGKAHLARLKEKADSVGLLYRIGNHFGESVLMSISGVRQETVTAETATELYSMSKEDLEYIWSYMAPEDRQKFRNDLLSRNGNVWHSFDDTDAAKTDVIVKRPRSFALSRKSVFLTGNKLSQSPSIASPSQQRRKKSSHLFERDRLRSFSAEASIEFMGQCGKESNGTTPLGSGKHRRSLQKANRAMNHSLAAFEVRRLVQSGELSVHTEGEDEHDSSSSDSSDSSPHTSCEESFISDECNGRIIHSSRQVWDPGR